VYEVGVVQVVESHQSSKADTSGTAKALVASLGQLVGQPQNVEDIQKIREREQQVGRVRGKGLDGGWVGGGRERQESERYIHKDRTTETTLSETDPDPETDRG
jgi:hypothetical protein